MKVERTSAETRYTVELSEEQAMYLRHLQCVTLPSELASKATLMTLDHAKEIEAFLVELDDALDAAGCEYDPYPEVRD